MLTKTKLLTLVAALSAINVAFRMGLAEGPPNVKPVAFFVIVGGIVGGPVAGFAIGLLSMTLSDFFTQYGPGIWTLETSSFMAIVGLIAGLLWHKAGQFNWWKMAVVGFLLTMVFDIGTSLADVVIFGLPLRASILGLYVPFWFGLSPWPFGLAHELTTAILLGAIGPSLIYRIRKFYT